MNNTESCFVVQEGEVRLENYDDIQIRIVLRITNKMRWFCAYLGYPKEYDLNIQHGDPRIRAHGGITFSQDVKSELMNLNENERNNYKWIGWDYQHCDDLTNIADYESNTKRLTHYYYKEVEDDVAIAVIDLIKCIPNNNTIHFSRSKKV